MKAKLIKATDKAQMHTKQSSTFSGQAKTAPTVIAAIQTVVKQRQASTAGTKQSEARAAFHAMFAN